MSLFGAAPTARAETLGVAVAGPVSGSTITVGLDADALADAMIQRGVVGGVPRAAVIALAQRVAADVEDTDQALRELERAVEIAVRVREEGAHGSNLGAFVDDVLQRLAGLTAAGRLDEANSAAGDAFADWERAEADRRKDAKAQGLRLLGAGVNQALLDRDPVTVAARIAKMVELDIDLPEKRTHALLQQLEQWRSMGEGTARSIDLRVAAALGELAEAKASTHQQKGEAAYSHGVCLAVLHELRAEPKLKANAIDALRRAVELYSQADDEVGTAVAKTALATALASEAAPVSDQSTLVEAIKLQREALEVFQRLGPAISLARVRGNLGETLRKLASLRHELEGLRESATHLWAAMKYFKRRSFISEWSGFAVNFANSISEIGLITDRLDLVRRATFFLAGASKIFHQRRQRKRFAEAQMALASILVTFARRRADRFAARAALEAADNAAGALDRETAPKLWRRAVAIRGRAHAFIADSNEVDEHDDQAIADLSVARSLAVKEENPIEWGDLTIDLAAVVGARGNKARDLVQLRRAVSISEEAYAVYSTNTNLDQWAKIECLRANLHGALAAFERSPALAEAGMRIAHNVLDQCAGTDQAETRKMAERSFDRLVSLATNLRTSR